MSSALSWEHLLDQLRLEFGSAIFYHCGPEWRPVPRVTPDEQLHLVHAGALEYTIDGTIHRAQAGHLVFCPMGIEWTTRRVSRKFVDLTVIHFQARFPGGRRYLDALGFEPVLSPDAHTWKTLFRLGSQMCSLYRKKPPGHILKELALLHDFFYAVFSMRGEPAPMDRDGERMLKLIGYMGQHYPERITLESLSRVVFVSANYLATIFREYTGRSPIDYLIQIRLDEACRLLRLPERAIGDITKMVGYEDPAYFSRLFRRHIGISPLGYRRERRSVI